MLKSLISSPMDRINIQFRTEKHPVKHGKDQACPLRGPRAKCGPRRHPKIYQSILSSKSDPRF